MASVASAAPIQTKDEADEKAVVRQIPPLPNRFELARNWSLLSSRELLTVTTFVDAKDSVNNWCVGQIIEENVD